MPRLHLFPPLLDAKIYCSRGNIPSHQSTPIASLSYQNVYLEMFRTELWISQLQYAVTIGFGQNNLHLWSAQKSVVITWEGKETKIQPIEDIWMSNMTVDQQILCLKRNLRDKERSFLRLKVLPQENAPSPCTINYATKKF